MKTTIVTYIESGTFQGSEEHTSGARINYDDECVVMKSSAFEQFLEQVERALTSWPKSESFTIEAEAAQKMIQKTRKHYAAQFKDLRDE